jgi:hypothetical protein
MTPGAVPVWFAELGDEDREFVRRFVLASGSLKELAEGYGVSYPTIRVRLDRLIAKVKAADAARAADPLERKVRVLVAEGAIDAATGKQLLAAHKVSLTGRGE